MNRFLLTKFKTDWAVGLQQHRRVLARNNKLGDTALRNGTPPLATAQASTDDDAVFVESPTTVNHNYPAPPPSPPAPRQSPLPWLIAGVSVLGAALAISGWRPPNVQVATAPPTTVIVPTAPAPIPTPVPAPQSGRWEIYAP